MGPLQPLADLVEAGQERRLPAQREEVGQAPHGVDDRGGQVGSRRHLDARRGAGRPARDERHGRADHGHGGREDEGRAPGRKGARNAEAAILARTAAADGISTRTASCSSVSMAATIRLSRSPPGAAPQHGGPSASTAP